MPARIIFRRILTLRERASKNASSSSSSPPHPPPPPPPSTSSSRITHLISVLTSNASRRATQAIQLSSKATTDATELATTNVKDAAAKASSDIRHSIANAKINAKQTEQYAWEARRRVSRIRENLEESMKHTAQKSVERMNNKISKATQSTALRLKNEFSRRMPTMPKLPLKKTSSTKSSLSLSSSFTLPSREHISKVLPKDALLASASHIVSDTVTKATANVATHARDTLNKTTRWLWWWGLAAVCVYGISTTLTKEGVQLLRDMMKSTTGASTVGSVDAAVAPASSETIDTRHVVIAEKTVGDKNNSSSRNNSGRWLSRWYYARQNPSGNGGTDEPT